MFICFFFLFQAEDGIRDLVRSRGLGDVYKRQIKYFSRSLNFSWALIESRETPKTWAPAVLKAELNCLLYTSDAADERSSVDLGGRRNIKKKKHIVKLHVPL